jgi:hypothetical protein
MLTSTFSSAVHLGQVWIIYPLRTDPVTGKQGVAELFYDLGPKARDTVAIYSDISKDGKLAYFTLTTANHVAALDISDLNNVKRLDNPDEQQPIIGPHYVKISPDHKNLLVTGYFVQAGSVSLTITLYCLFHETLMLTTCSCRSPSSTHQATTRVTGLT